jgi:DNA-directed RNA polymerase specialized sigma24 family protein
VRLFTLNRVVDPQALADEAMDRLARRVAEAPGIIESPSAFVLGIARHLLQEDERRRIREREAANEWASQITAQSGATEELEELMEIVEECLSGMKLEQQELLRGYYGEIGRGKIEHHRQLAAQQGLTLNALRNRLMRARRELDECVRRRLRDVSDDGSTKR